MTRGVWRHYGVAVIVMMSSLLASTLSTRHARAADAGTADANDNDIKALEKRLNAEHAALSTSDCTAACRALGSIRRAADKICAIEPGPRCDTAREKAADATRRVHDACPDCAVAFGTEPPPPAKAAREPSSEVSHDKAGSPPPSAPDKRGGCASCSATTDAGGWHGDLAIIMFAAFGVLRLSRSRRDPQRRRR